VAEEKSDGKEDEVNGDGEKIIEVDEFDPLYPALSRIYAASAIWAIRKLDSSIPGSFSLLSRKMAPNIVSQWGFWEISLIHSYQKDIS